MKIAILGLGFVGSKVLKRLSEKHEVTGITRANYESLKGTEYDVFINCAGNSKKYLAEKDPKWDFEQNCTATFDTLYDFKFKRYVHLSTLDVYRESVYAQNKCIAEAILTSYQKQLDYDLIIIRSSFITGKDKDKGIIYDIQHEKTLGISKESKFQIITANGIINFIERALLKKDRLVVVNLSGYPAVSMEEIEGILGKQGIYKEGAPTHVYDYSVEDARKYSHIKTSEEYLRESLVE